MQKEILIAGFGGQGILFAGQVLAYAAMDAGKVVTWIPSYGPEMRGGTAHCTVVIADEEIGSPWVLHPAAAIVMNLPSFNKYEPLVQPEGVLIVNQNMVDRPAQRTDLITVFLPANEIAEEIGDRRLINMVVVGGLLAVFPVLTLDDVKAALHSHLPEKHKRLLPQNMLALDRGFAYAQAAGIKVA